MTENPQLQFASFVVTDRSEEKQGQARMLGECVLDLGTLMG